MQRTAVEPLEGSRQHRVPRERVRKAAGSGHRRRRRGQQHDDAAQGDHDDHHVTEEPGELGPDRVGDSRERREPPLVPECGRPVLHRERGDSNHPDRDRDGHDRADPREETPRQRSPGLPRLGREVGDGLEAGVGEHRERERERQLVPGGLRAEVDSPERVHIEEQGEAEDDQERVRHHRDQRDRHCEAVELRPAHEPDSRERDDHRYSDHDVPGRVAQPFQPERGQVVRHEQRGERGHDQVVEEQYPARRKAGRVVERPPHEQRGAAGLGHRRRSLRVRDRHEQEDDTCREQDERCEPERIQRDDAEREVQGRADLAVRDRGERTAAEHPRQAFETPRHQLLRRR